MLRDYVCSLCSNRYEYMPPDGCFCSDHKTTVYYDGMESNMLREKQQREREKREKERQEQAAQLKAQEEAQKKAQIKSKQKPKTPAKSSSDTGPTLGVLTFLAVGLFIYFGLEEHYGIAIAVGCVAGIIVRYTYKLIIFIILLILAYYIYTVTVEKNNSSTFKSTYKESVSEPQKSKVSSSLEQDSESKSEPTDNIGNNTFDGNWKIKRVKYNSISLQHNQIVDNQEGMNIIINFDISYAQYTDCMVVVWFYYDNGKRLEDYNSRYNTISGQVSTDRTFKPLLRSYRYQDFKVFIPYDELHLEQKGTHRLKYNLQFFSDNKPIGEPSEFKYFRITYKN